MYRVPYLRCTYHGPCYCTTPTLVSTTKRKKKESLLLLLQVSCQVSWLLGSCFLPPFRQLSPCLCIAFLVNLRDDYNLMPSSNCSLLLVVVFLFAFFLVSFSLDSFLLPQLCLYLVPFCFCAVRSECLNSVMFCQITYIMINFS